MCPFIEEVNILWSRTTKLHGRTTLKYGKIMWRPIRKMWGKARVFDIFWFGFLQKLGKLVRIWIKNEPIGETLVKSPNLALEKKVSKSEKYENVTFSSSNSVKIQNESTKWKIWATATTNFQYQPFFGQIGHLVHQKWHFFGQNLNFWAINLFDCSFMAS